MLRLLLVLFSVSFTCPAFALIYGADDRQEALTSWAKPQASAVLLMTSRNFVVDEGDPNFVKLDFSPATGDGSLINMCSNQRFAQQLTAGINCSGFLIAPDLVVTAGHCIVPYGRTQNAATAACTDFVWIADFAQPADGSPLKVDKWPREKIFECAEVLDGQNPDFSSAQFAPPLFGDDFALIRLQKPITDRKPFMLSQERQAPEKLYAMGFPLGLPMKLTGPARVMDQSYAKFYTANLDTFMGNSGSAIFDEKGLVHGILVRGYPEDFITDGGMCYTQNTCTENGESCVEKSDFFGTGSHVQRLDVIHVALAKYRERNPSQTPLVSSLRSLFSAPVKASLFAPPRSRGMTFTGARRQTFIDPNRPEGHEVLPKRSSPVRSGE